MDARALAARPRGARRGGRLSRARWIEPALFTALALFALVPILAMLRHAGNADLVFLGANGPFAGDQLQYMSWIREYEDGVLAANGFDAVASDRVFFHPMFFVSGVALAVGAGMAFAHLLWAPVAVVALFFGFRAFVRRFLDGTGERAAALAIALFFATPVAALAGWGRLGSEGARGDVIASAGELLPAALLWGYLPAAISVGLMPPFLLGVERIVRRLDAGESPGARLVALVAACGALSSWLHPWQGEILLVTAAGAILLSDDGRRVLRRGLVPLAVPLAAVVAPLAYYFLLSRFDGAWDFAQEANASEGTVRAWAAALAVLPLLLPALLSVRTVGRDVGERMLLIWPVAALAVYVVLSPSFPLHALEGVALPLGIVAVRGAARLRRPGLALAALAVTLAVPGSLYMADWLRDTVSAGGQPHYLTRDEDRALDYLGDSGGDAAVLTTPYLGSTVPARSGLRTWVGHPSWTPDFHERVERSAALFGGRLARGAALELVESSGVRYLLLDCGTPPGPIDALRPTVVPDRTFGCARVYRVASS